MEQSAIQAEEAKEPQKMEIEEKKEEPAKKTNMEMFSAYYEHLFPYNEIVDWLSYYTPAKPGEYNEYFKNREFSFTLEGDIYFRYQSFSGPRDLKETLLRKNPVKIDIGAVFNLQPKFNKQYKKAEEQTLVPLEKELVFDIDMTDYDPVRTCCKDATICLKCWKFIKIAHHILDQALRKDFGFKNLLWVYSGRRGIHCWVCDERARRLTNDCREKIIEYLSVYSGNETSDVRPNLFWPLHPSMKRAAKVLEDYMEDIMEDQGLLDIDKHRSTLLKFIDGFPDAVKEVNEEWAKCSNSAEKWRKYKTIVDRHETSRYKCAKNTTEIMFKFLYPRLDVNVSKSRNHLLKSVFSLHPSTGRVCVPIEDITKFNPLEAPTINQLLLEKKEYLAAGNDPEKFVENSSMGEYVGYFRKFIVGLEKRQFTTIEEIQAAYKNSVHEKMKDIS